MLLLRSRGRRLLPYLTHANATAADMEIFINVLRLRMNELNAIEVCSSFFFFFFFFQVRVGRKKSDVVEIHYSLIDKCPSLTRLSFDCCLFKRNPSLEGVDFFFLHLIDFFVFLRENHQRRRFLILNPLLSSDITSFVINTCHL